LGLTLTNLLLIGSAGFIGAILRYSLSGLVHGYIPASSFPYGTLAVNLVGCFLIGSVIGFFETRQIFNPELRLFLLIGLLGSFTTFSTFSYETFAMLHDGENIRALINIGSNIVVGITLVWLGYTITSVR